MATHMEAPSPSRLVVRSTSQSGPLLPALTADGTTDWRVALPVLYGLRASMRELRLSDAASLFATLSSKEVARFIAPPPATLEEFEQFITWAANERIKGTYVCFAVVPKTSDAAIGIFQLRRLDGADTAEWGFALGSAFWGTGIFPECAALVLNFAFETIGIHRLEGRATTANGRGNGALRKAGATQEGVLRRSFKCQGQLVDQYLWSILRDEWRRKKAPLKLTVH